jgi:hypothetical protein
MGSSGKSFALILILIMAISSLSLFMVKPVNAQTIPTPSVPEFTVKVNSTALQITIKNQPFTPYVSNGQNISLYFDVRVRNETDQAYSVMYTAEFTYPTPSASEYTTLTYIWIENENEDLLRLGDLLEQTPPSTNVSFEVQAMIGSINNPVRGGELVFNGTESSWSSPQTVTMPAVIIPVTPFTTLPTAPLSYSEVLLLIGAVAILVVVILLSLLLLLRHRKTASARFDAVGAVCFALSEPVWWLERP